MAKKTAPDQPQDKLLLVPVSPEDHRLVADYAFAKHLPTVEAGAAMIIAEWCGRERIRLAAKKRQR